MLLTRACLWRARAFNSFCLSCRHVRHRQNDFSTTSAAPLRLAVIGSGPAGFYTARRLMQKNDDVRIDMYEQLPVPYGLVRYGVAPDHPEVKNCQDTFEEVAESPRFEFVGNVEVGRQIALPLLRQHYDGLVFAYGASEDRLLGLPGERLEGVYSARAFVGWYNGLPEFEHLSPRLEDAEQAVVIGNGNVALDVARILLAPLEDLRKTDISLHALDALARSKVKKVVVAGRRGPMQVAFTIKELRELLTLRDVGFHFENPDLIPSADYISKLSRLEQRKYRFSELLARGSNNPLDAASKSWSLLSMASPTAFKSSDSASLSSIDFEMNAFADLDRKYDKAASVTASGEIFNLPADVAFRSIGYKSVALPGMEDVNVLFDHRRGMLANDGSGRVYGMDGKTLSPGMYCTGWVRNGPTGVIASTMNDAFATADAILADLLMRQSSRTDKGGWAALKLQTDVQVDQPIRWADWKRFDSEERRLGQAKGKEREKFTSISKMLKIISG